MSIEFEEQPRTRYLFTRIKLGPDDKSSPVYEVAFSRQEMKAIEGLRDIFYSKEIQNMAFSEGSLYAYKLWHALPAEEGLMHRENSLSIIKQLFDFNRDAMSVDGASVPLLNTYELQLAGLVNQILEEAFPAIADGEQ